MSYELVETDNGWRYTCPDCEWQGYTDEMTDDTSSWLKGTYCCPDCGYKFEGVEE